MAEVEEEKRAKKLAKKLKKRAREEAALVKDCANGSQDLSAPKKKKKQKVGEHEEEGSPFAAATENGQSRRGIDTQNAGKTSNKKSLKSAAQLSVPAEDLAEQPVLPEKTKKKKNKSGKANAANDGAQTEKEGALGRVVKQTQDSSLAKVGNMEAMRTERPLTKKLYQQHPDVTALPAATVSEWLAERGIVVENCSLRPVLDFAQTGLSEALLHATRTFAAPSPIQAQCLPIALSGQDLVGIAATGSGKTLAFGLPCLRHIQAQVEEGSSTGGLPRALMVSPTRELAQQIAAVMEEAGEKCGLKTLCVYGGVPKMPQAKQLKRGVDIVVATPGRLEDLMNDGACKVEKVSYLVLDEADRMLDLGFEPHIRAIAGRTRVDRQTLMFSATWPSEVQKLALEYLANPAKVTIGSQDLSASHSVTQSRNMTEGVTQIVEVIEPSSRPKRLLELLKKYHSSRKNRVLVFVLYKKEASRVEETLNSEGWQAAAIHGDISQAQRSKAVEQFKSGKMPLLVATDVAARGLDIPDVEVVINYSFPLTTEDYVHRIGRTGRAGKTGLAHTFFSGATDKARSGELISVLKEAGQTVPPELLSFGVTTKKKESKLYGAHFREIDHSKKATKIVFDD